MKNTVLEKRPVTPVLREMQIGEVQTWHPSQLNSIRVKTSDLKIMEGKKYKRQLSDGLICVTRVK